MKKLINAPTDIVRELLEGLVQLTPGVALLGDETVVVRTDIPAEPERRPVAILSGGGSGHEPAHAGYVGPGMLTAAIAGDVFTSPSTDAVLAAILAVSGPAGALLVVKNYTGDRLNFGLAAELARQRGIPVEIVVVADDVALRDTVIRERRRGIAGTVLIHKLCGAAAAAGLPLQRIAEIARAACTELGTMGVGLGPCIVPAAGVPGFELGEDEIELGLGIHGEKGVARTRLGPVDALVDQLLGVIRDELKPAPGARVALLVNGLGGTSQMELLLVARRAVTALRESGVEVARAWCGAFMTAMEMPGCSLSVLILNDERDGLLAAPAGVTAWPGDGAIPQRLARIPAPQIAAEQAAPDATGPAQPALQAALAAVAEALTAAEDRLTELDSRAGDGDLGASMVRGAAAIRALDPTSCSNPARLLAMLGNSLRRAIAGSSGPFYATALLRASAALRGSDNPDAAQWLDAFAGAVQAISDLGGAKPGDRTMLDALVPAVDAFRAAAPQGAVAALKAAADAAEAGAEATAAMAPALGRASYLGARAIGAPDAGAAAVAVWLRAIADRVGSGEGSGR